MTDKVSQYTTLPDFLSKHHVEEGEIGTHTRIQSKKLNIHGGHYCIKKEELPMFRKLYYQYVFVKGHKEYLTEKQLGENGPLLIDFDFHYDYSVTKRQHSLEHIEDIISLYLEELKQFFIFDDAPSFPIFVMEKDNVNRVADKNITKDGIHIIFGIQINNTLQLMLRDRILEQIGDVWDLPIINSWDKVLDEGISKGCVNWQMYGSQKPGHEPYKLTHYLTAELDKTDNCWCTKSIPINQFDLSKQFHLLSAQYDSHIELELQPNIKEEYEKRLTTNKKTKSKPKVKHSVSLTNSGDGDLSLEDITNHELLRKAIDDIMSKLKTNELYIKETHDYVQILPEKYYEPGSHIYNTQVAFALKNTDERLFLSWIMLRSKASDFDFADIPRQYQRWNRDFGKRENGVTRASILYWAKQDAYDKYIQVKNSTIDKHIDDTIYDATEWDLAYILYLMFKDKYVCSSITHKHWYVFNNNRWEKDEGQRLRMAISKDLYELYIKKQEKCMAEVHSGQDEESNSKIQRKIKMIAQIGIKLKKTNDKNNIMREAMEIFYDRNFTKQLDANPYLLCFTNGVFDFEKKEFRKGYPQDYITKSTGIPYITDIDEEFTKIEGEILAFMNQLFPIPNVCKYMWDHLAAVLIGVKKEQVINIYRGSGSNGKSILIDLMSLCLGEYKGTVPITLITDKRSSIGGATPEIMQLKGLRYAVAQEPSKDAVLNEGILKELTGGDPLLGRALYCDSETFISQFSLAVCTNSLFKVNSNDDGTWRRMMLIDFLAKFVSEGEIYTDDTKYVFPKDKTLNKKFPKWAPVFMHLLVKRACETEGEVKLCEEIANASNKYRQSQDAISGFITDRIIEGENKHGVSQMSLNNMFKEWYAMNYGGRKPPGVSELVEVVVKKFGSKHPKKGKWYTFSIKEDEEKEDDLDDI